MKTRPYVGKGRIYLLWMKNEYEKLVSLLFVN